jgi:hypothetical protein
MTDAANVNLAQDIFSLCVQDIIDKLNQNPLNQENREIVGSEDFADNLYKQIFMEGMDYVMSHPDRSYDDEFERAVSACEDLEQLLQRLIPETKKNQQFCQQLFQGICLIYIKLCQKFRLEPDPRLTSPFSITEMMAGLNLASESNQPSTAESPPSESNPYSRLSIDLSALQQAEVEVPDEWKVGDRLLNNLYEVEEEVGIREDGLQKGGFGRVYKVLHTGWNISLAVKTPQAEQLQKIGGVENFIREAETWVKLGLHPHIVTCFYVRKLGKSPRVFAEFVSGGSLHDWIYGKDGESPKLYQGGHAESFKRILDIAIQFAWGLHYSHEQGLIHQDVKPGNTMMTPDGTVKVTDFGLARARPIEPI